MIKFFRQIRRKLIDQDERSEILPQQNQSEALTKRTEKREGRLKKYLIYSIGEILLVVIGILIALQINNWNENKKDRNTENKLLIELNENLKTNSGRLNSDIQNELRSIESIDFVVNHILKRRAYDDSLDVYFRNALFSPDIVLATSGYEAVKSKGFEIVEKDKLRKAIIDLYDVTYANLLSETIRLEDQFWPTAVLPAVHKHFMFTELGAKPVDYTALLNDTKYINMILHRKHFREQAFDLKTASLKQTESLLKLIGNELPQKR